MKILTVRQPWASLIVAGIKQVETRARPTKYRGPVLIHSSYRRPPEYWDLFHDKDFGPYLEFILHPGDIREQRVKYDKLPLGYIVGRVDITGSEDAGIWVEKRMKGGPSAHDEYDREWILGDLSSDRFAWTLANAKEIDGRPFGRIKGQLGLWNYMNGLQIPANL